jgi:hypothetical protein
MCGAFCWSKADTREHTLLGTPGSRFVEFTFPQSTSSKLVPVSGARCRAGNLNFCRPAFAAQANCVSLLTRHSILSVCFGESWLAPEGSNSEFEMNLTV